MRGELGLGDRGIALGGRGRNGGGEGKQGDSRNRGVETGGFHGAAAWHFRRRPARRVRQKTNGGPRHTLFSVIPAKAGISPVRQVVRVRSEEHTSELQSLMRISYAGFCLQKKNTHTNPHPNQPTTR